MDAALRPPRTRRRQRGNAMATRARLVAVVGAFAPSFVDRVHIIGASHIVVVGASSDDDASLLRHSNRHRVDFMYTYGAPSTSSPHVSNPGNKCIPGIRAYTEDVSSGHDCDWWQVWCNESDHVTNVDFASRWNDYPHPKMSILVLRQRDDDVIEYIYEGCVDDDNIARYDYQYWPHAHQPASILPGYNVHDLEGHYERRLAVVPSRIRGPLLEYVAVSKCGSKTSMDALVDCLYRHGSADEWIPLAHMRHVTDYGSFGDDEDVVFVLKNDSDQDNGVRRRRCIISFAGSDNVAGDHWKFLMDNSREAGYCGRRGVHVGVRNELRQITRDDQYYDIIRPALETCHEVTCVGYSLGGSLCNLFTMCANRGGYYLDDGVADGEEMYRDYDSLAWTKAMYDDDEVYSPRGVNPDGADDDYSYDGEESWRE